MPVSNWDFRLQHSSGSRTNELVTSEHVAPGNTVVEHGHQYPTAVDGLTICVKKGGSSGRGVSTLSRSYRIEEPCTERQTLNAIISEAMATQVFCRYTQSADKADFASSENTVLLCDDSALPESGRERILLMMVDCVRRNY